MWCCSSQSRGSTKNACASSAGRCVNGRAHHVDARQEAADPFQHFDVVELRRAAAAARTDAELEPGVPVQCRAAQDQRADGRHFGRHQFGRERVLLEDLRLAPAAGPVELGDDGGVTLPRRLQVRLVDAVLIGAQGQQPAVAVQADGGQRVEHDVGRERVEGMGGHAPLSPHASAGAGSYSSESTAGGRVISTRSSNRSRKSRSR